MFSCPAKTDSYGKATHITSKGSWVAGARTAAEVIGAKMGEQQQAPGAKDLWVKVVCGRERPGWRMGAIPQHPLKGSLMAADEGAGQATEGMRRRWSVHRLAA
jgi:hypothetical protein